MFFRFERKVLEEKLRKHEKKIAKQNIKFIKHKRKRNEEEELFVKVLSFGCVINLHDQSESIKFCRKI